MERRAIILIWCFVSLLPLNTSSQFIQSIDVKTMDSLELILPNTQGRGRIDLLNQLAELYAWYNPEKSEIYSSEALDLSIKADYQDGMGTALYTIGSKKYIEGDPASAIDYYQRAIEVLESTHDYYTLGKVYVRYCAALFNEGNDKVKWMEYLPRGMELFQAAGNKRAESTFYFLVSSVYFRTNQPKKSLEYIQKFWDLIEESGTHNLYLAMSYSFVGTCYWQLGDTTNTYKLNEMGINQFNDGVFEELSLKSQAEKFQGTYFLNDQKIDSAMIYYHLSLEHGKANGNAFNMMSAYYLLAKLFYSESEIETCRAYCDSAMEVAAYIDSTGKFYFNDTLNHCIAMFEDVIFPSSILMKRRYAWETKNRCYQILWDVYLKNNDLMQAVQIQGPWMAVRDSIYAYKRNRDILELKVGYETEKKEHELARLSEDNMLKEARLKLSYWIVASLASLVLLILILAVLLNRQNKLRNEQNTLLLQQRLLRSQMNPHFLYNTLASIQNFIIKQQPEEASHYLSKFSKLVRQILISSTTEYVSLDDELRSMKNYLTLQKIRYREMFDYVIEMDAEMDLETISIPPMLAQPFIENAIEHGIKHKGSKGHIRINLMQKEDAFLLAIEDDGVGRAKAREIEQMDVKDHKSMATSITLERLANFNRKLRRKISFMIIDLKDDFGNPIGTKVVFEIPLNL